MTAADLILQVQGVLGGFYGVQEAWNAQNTVAFNSPNDKLSNVTPYEYGIWTYKISVFEGFLGF